MQDIRGQSCVHENMEHPVAPFLYTISTMHCMSVSARPGRCGARHDVGRAGRARDARPERDSRSVDLHRLPHDEMNDFYVCAKQAGGRPPESPSLGRGKNGDIPHFGETRNVPFSFLSAAECSSLGGRFLAKRWRPREALQLDAHALRRPGSAMRGPSAGRTRGRSASPSHRRTPMSELALHRSVSSVELRSEREQADRSQLARLTSTSGRRGQRRSRAQAGRGAVSRRTKAIFVAQSRQARPATASRSREMASDGEHDPPGPKLLAASRRGRPRTPSTTRLKICRDAERPVRVGEEKLVDHRATQPVPAASRLSGERQSGLGSRQSTREASKRGLRPQRHEGRERHGALGTRQQDRVELRPVQSDGVDELTLGDGLGGSRPSSAGPSGPSGPPAEVPGSRRDSASVRWVVPPGRDLVVPPSAQGLSNDGSAALDLGGDEAGRRCPRAARRLRSSSKPLARPTRSSPLPGRHHR